MLLYKGVSKEALSAIYRNFQSLELRMKQKIRLAYVEWRQAAFYGRELNRTLKMHMMRLGPLYGKWDTNLNRGFRVQRSVTRTCGRSVTTTSLRELLPGLPPTSVSAGILPNIWSRDYTTTTFLNSKTTLIITTCITPNWQAYHTIHTRPPRFGPRTHGAKMLICDSAASANEEEKKIDGRDDNCV